MKTIVAFVLGAVMGTLLLSATAQGPPTTIAFTAVDSFSNFVLLHTNETGYILAHSALDPNGTFAPLYTTENGYARAHTESLSQAALAQIAAICGKKERGKP